MQATRETLALNGREFHGGGEGGVKMQGRGCHNRTGHSSCQAPGTDCIVIGILLIYTCEQGDGLLQIATSELNRSFRDRFQHETNAIQPPHSKSTLEKGGSKTSTHSEGNLILSWTSQLCRTSPFVNQGQLELLRKSFVSVPPPVRVSSTWLVARRALSKSGLTSSGAVFGRGSAVAK